MTQQEETPDFEELRREAHAWVIRIRSGDATADDTAALIRWHSRSPSHAEALAEAVRLRRLIAEAGREDLEPRALNIPHIAMLPLPPRVRRQAFGRRAFLRGALAASVGGVMLVRPPMGLWPSLAELRSDYRTGTGERRTIALARGTSVELNTRTSVSLRSDDHHDRLVLIAGEVAVDAPHPLRPVAIRTDAGEAMTSAGRFGVRLEDAGTCVTCLDGRVMIVAGEDRKVELAAGQQLTFVAGSLGNPVTIDKDRAEAWRRGLLIFSGEPLSHVVDEINRYRLGKIILTNADLGHITVNAVFQLDRIDRAPTQIREVANARVTALPGGVVLLS